MTSPLDGRRIGDDLWSLAIVATMGKRRWEVRFVYCCKQQFRQSQTDWNIDRFSLLRDHLASLTDESGEPLCNVTARNREVNTDGNDAVLSLLDTTDFDELWLFAVDSGNGLTVADCQGITQFRQRGGGILTARDHQDLGSSLCTLGRVGR